MPIAPNFHVALVEPDIPHNTGAIARLCVATRSRLHLVGRLGFHLDDRYARRAGLDYWEHADIVRPVDLAECMASVPGAAAFYFSAHAEREYSQARFPPGAVLVFGSETRGLPASILERKEECWRIPILDERVRSLNLATAVGIVLYEALRQNPDAIGRS